MQIQFTQRRVASLATKNKPYEVRDKQVKGLVLRVQPTGTKVFYYRYRTLDGRRGRLKLGCHKIITVDQAREQAIGCSTEVLAGHDPKERRQSAKIAAQNAQLRTLGAFIDAEYEPWFIEHRRGGVRAVTGLRRTFGFLMNSPMESITPLVIERWRTQKAKSGTSKATLNRSLTAIRSCLNKAVEWGYLDINPMARVRPYKLDQNKHVVRYLEGQEEMNLRKALDDRERQLQQERDRYNQWRTERDYPLYPDLKTLAFADHLKPLILLAMNTGMRKGELLKLKWGHISFDHKILTVTGENAKSGQSRFIPLNQEALSVLQRWQAQCKNLNPNTHWVFTNHKGEPLADIKTAWSSLLKRANITNFRFHDLRHHFASQLVMAGVDLNTIRELLGHKDYSSTLRYAHLSPNILMDAVAKLKPRQWEGCNTVLLMR